MRISDEMRASYGILEQFFQDIINKGGENAEKCGRYSKELEKLQELNSTGESYDEGMFWPSLRDALLSENLNSKEFALTALQRLITQDIFFCNTEFPEQQELPTANLETDTSLRQIIPYEALKKIFELGNEEPPKGVLDDLIDILCNISRRVPKEMMHLQIIQILLNTFISVKNEIHSAKLLKIILTFFYINLNSTFPAAKKTAKAALIQVLNIVVFRMEQSYLLIKIVENLKDEKSQDETADKDESQYERNSENSGENNHVKYVTGMESTDAQDGAQDIVSGKTLEMENVMEIKKKTLGNMELKECNEILVQDLILILKSLYNASLYTSNESKLNTASKGQAEEDREISEDEIKLRIIALELILSILNNSGDAFKSKKEFTNIVKDYIIPTVIKNSGTNDSLLFEISCSIFLIGLRSYKYILKSEIAVMINDIYLNIIESYNFPIWKRLLAIQTLKKLCENYQILAHIYISYGYDVDTISVFERIISTCGLLAQSKTQYKQTKGLVGLAASAVGFDKRIDTLRLRENKLKNSALSCLLTILNTISNILEPKIEKASSKEPTSGDKGEIRGVDSGHKNKLPAVSDDKKTLTGRSYSDILKSKTTNTPIIPSKNPLEDVSMSFDLLEEGNIKYAESDAKLDPESLLSRKALLNHLLARFNTNPHLGISLLIDNHFLEENAQSVADFLFNAVGISKTSIGEYLGGGENFCMDVMRNFVDHFDFTDTDLNKSLRYFLDAFRLPGEAQKIDRILERFSDRYYQDNSSKFPSADSVYTLTFSIIMLNTDLHSKQIKQKMTKNDFIKNNSRLNGADFSEELLSDIYNDILHNEIILSGKNNSNKLMIMAKNWGAGSKSLETKNISENKSKNQTPLISPRDPKLPELMFSTAFWPIIVTLNIVLDSSEDKFSEEDESVYTKATDYCFRGIIMCAYISGILNMDSELNSLLCSLVKLTNLQECTTMNNKNYKALCALIHIATYMGEYLNLSWKCIFIPLMWLQNLKNSGKAICAKSTLKGTTPQETKGGINTEESRANPEDRQNNECKKIVLAANNNNNPNGISDIYIPSEDLFNQVDRIFSLSIYLSSAALIKMVTCLCDCSLFELDLKNNIQESILISSKNTFKDIKNIFFTNKIVDVSCFNVNRIRFEWSQIWQVIGNYFEKILLHPNIVIVKTAIVAIKNIEIKFFERQEPDNFSLKDEIISGYSLILSRTPDKDIVLLILEKITEMINTSQERIRSGWKKIFQIILESSRATEEDVCRQECLKILKTILCGDSVEFVLESNQFESLVQCIAYFSLTNCPEMNDNIVKHNTSLLKRALDIILKKFKEASSEDRNKRLPEEIKRSVLCLCEVIKSPKNPIIFSLAVNTLFYFLQSIKDYAAADLWLKLQESIFPCIKYRISNKYKSNIRSENTYEGDIILVCNFLNNYEDLFSGMFEKLIQYENGLLLKSFFESLVEFLDIENEKLSLNVIISIHNAIKYNIYHFDKYPYAWDIMVEYFDKIFEATIFEKLLDKGYAEDAYKLRLNLMYNKSGKGHDSTNSDSTHSANHTAVGFDNMFVKCVTHLNFICLIRDIPFIEILIPVNPKNSRCSFKIAEKPENADILQKYPEQGKDPSDETAYREAFLISVLRKDISEKILKLLYRSYDFAKSFNGNENLRTTIYKYNLVPQVPHLAKQECAALAGYMKILFLICNDLIKYPDDKNDAKYFDEKISLLIELFLDLFKRFASFLENPTKNAAYMSLWPALMSSLLDDMQVIISLANEESKKDALKDYDFNIIRSNILPIFKAAVQLVGIEVPQLQSSLKSLIVEIGNIYIGQE